MSTKRWWQIWVTDRHTQKPLFRQFAYAENTREARIRFKGNFNIITPVEDEELLGNLNRFCLPTEDS